MPKREAARWQTVSQTPKSAVKKSANSHQYAPPSSIGTMSILGSDEVGTGDFFGPMTVVAVYVDAKQIPLLKELGVKDSKNLNDLSNSLRLQNNSFTLFLTAPSFFIMKNITSYLIKETTKVN